MSTTTEKWTIFGERLKTELERQEMSLRQFADKAGLTLTTACRYVHSQRTPRATEILKAAKVLGVTCDYMLGLSDDPHKTRDGWAKAGFHELPSAQPDSKETSPTHKALDTISRQAAIRWVKTECNPYGKPTLDFESGKKVIEHLKQMPPAQPETHDKRTETHACDLISRQAAIDYCYQLINVEYEQGSDEMNYGQERVNQTETILHHLELMPSAQPDSKELSFTHKALDTISRQDAIRIVDGIDTWQAGWRGDAIESMKALPSAQPDLDEVYAHAETEAESRFHAQQRWIPCSERLPEEGQEILATTTDNAWGDVVIIRTYYKEMHKSVIAWMPLPKPYRAERGTDDKTNKGSSN